MKTGILASLLAAGIIAAGAQPILAADKGLVAFSQAEMTNEWRVMDTKEMEKAWKDAGYDFVWTNAKSDPAKQLADVEDLLARKPVVLDRRADRVRGAGAGARARREGRRAAARGRSQAAG